MMKNMFVLLQFFDNVEGPKAYKVIYKRHNEKEGSNKRGNPAGSYEQEKLLKKESLMRKKIIQYFGNLFNSANLGYFVHNFEGREQFSSCNYYFSIPTPNVRHHKLYLMLSLILPYHENPNIFRDFLISATHQIKDLQEVGKLLYNQEYTELDKILENLYERVNAHIISQSYI